MHRHHEVSSRLTGPYGDIALPPGAHTDGEARLWS
jgi:hypothetical protein